MGSTDRPRQTADAHTQRGTRGGMRGTLSCFVKDGAKKVLHLAQDGAKVTKRAMGALARDYNKEREAQARRAEYERKKAAEVAAYQRTQNGKKVSVSGYTRD